MTVPAPDHDRECPELRGVESLAKHWQSGGMVATERSPPSDRRKHRAHLGNSMVSSVFLHTTSTSGSATRRSDRLCDRAERQPSELL